MLEFKKRDGRGRNTLFVFCSPQHLIIFAKELLSVVPSFVIFDECHYISSFGCGFRSEFVEMQSAFFVPFLILI